MQILLPALPVIQETFAISNDVAQLTLSLSMLAIALGTLFYGPLSDKYGRKPVMLLGLCITFLGSIACLFAGHYRVADPRPRRSSLWGSGRAWCWPAL
jgi:DHA1 family bicyclomycin/chloramphenicol resistance-like MFS transporter